MIHNFLYPVLENASEGGIPSSKSGASTSRPRWAAHTRIGNVWDYPPPGVGPSQKRAIVSCGRVEKEEPESGIGKGIGTRTRTEIGTGRGKGPNINGM